jgi:predicted ATPase
MAYAELGQPDDARSCIDDAIDKVERSKEKWCEAEVHRIAGEIALQSPAPDREKAEKYFDRALTVARQQQTKSWLRAAMSLARLWRDQGKVQQARELLAPVYGWFFGVVRHARSERGEGTSWGIGGVRPSSGAADKTRENAKREIVK